ncbi:MAG TPA: VPLPA-CTERM-specific exosortase XrtD [Terriglobales bacterium]|nr:VPLPA-CTERM-specific exosortase XrtD [Terriglobales bacterium]
MGDSAQVAPLAAAREGRTFSGLLRFQAWWVLLLLGGWLYHSVLYNLALQWSKDPNFQHGWFVPAFSLYVLWGNRQRLVSIRPAPSWTGLPFVVFGLLLLAMGVLGIELYTQRSSLLFLLAGLILLLRGWEFFRAVFFPLAFLILMIPLPNLIYQEFTFPLQLLATRLSAEVLRLFFPVFREGNIIKTPHVPEGLNVVEACSGIRSLLSLITLSIIYGYLMEKRKRIRVALVCAAIPIAVLANAFRVCITGLVAEYWDPSMAKGKPHELTGLLVFVLSLLLLFALHSLINRVWPSSSAGASSVQPSSPRSEARRAAATTTPWSAGFLVAALLMTSTGVLLWARSRTEVITVRQPLSSLPNEIAGLNGVDSPPLDDSTLDILGHPEYVLRDYQNPGGTEPWVNLFVAYYASQKTGETPHTPAHCLPGAGWTLTQHRTISLRDPEGSSFPANRYVIVQGKTRALMIYWFEAQGREVSSEYKLKYYLVADSIRLHRSDGALVRMITPMFEGESADAAQARVMQFGDPLLRTLGNYIPR